MEQSTTWKKNVHTSRYAVLSLQDVVFAVHNMGNLILEDRLRYVQMWVHVDSLCSGCKDKVKG